MTKNLSVKEITELIYDKLKLIDKISVEGELSNIKKTNSKGTYFNLKDDTSSLSCVDWTNSMSNLVDGDKVVITGNIIVFRQHGSYQLKVENIYKIGIGVLHEQYELSKIQFRKDGYFSKSEKNAPLPTNIKRIAILTSTSVGSAAIEDVLYVLQSFYGEILIKNCNVQGKNCPSSVKNGIEYFNNIHETSPIDVLIITRGGGSFEDLIGFSDKEVVYAIHTSPIYVISAIGHEIDTMLSDYASDYRAPTPSIAGEVIMKKQNDMEQKFRTIQYKNELLNNIIDSKLVEIYGKIKFMREKLNSNNPINEIDNKINELNNINQKIHERLKSQMINIFNRINKCEKRNDMNDITKQHGFIMITDDNKNILNSVKIFKKYVNENSDLTIFFPDGKLKFNIKNIY